MKAFQLLVRSLVALLLGAVLFVAVSLLAWYGVGYAIGFSGHPAVPDLPMAAYYAYLGIAPLLSMACGFWVVFRRRGQAHSEPE